MEFITISILKFYYLQLSISVLTFIPLCALGMKWKRRKCSMTNTQSIFFLTIIFSAGSLLMLRGKCERWLKNFAMPEMLKGTSNSISLFLDCLFIIYPQPCVFSYTSHYAPSNSQHCSHNRVFPVFLMDHGSLHCIILVHATHSALQGWEQLWVIISYWSEFIHLISKPFSCSMCSVSHLFINVHSFTFLSVLSFKG